MKSAYQVAISPKAVKDLDDVPQPTFGKIDKRIRQLAFDPRPFGSKKLDEKVYRVRVNNWRVIYTVLDESRSVAVIRVMKRNERTYKISL